MQYRRLDAEKHEIRVLDVARTKSIQDKVACRARQISLDTHPTPQYETISYAWGDPTPCRQIQIDGHDFNVPMNTEMALRCATAREERTLWIDAVCINQNDVEERGQQVAMMGKLYSMCTMTWVYIGEEDVTTQRALDNLDQVHKEIVSTAGDRRGLQDLVYPQGLPIYAARAPCTPIDDYALASFFSRPWFSRVWVVQEVVLTPKATCLCGHMQRNMVDILDCAFFLGVHYSNHISDSLYNSGLARASNISTLAYWHSQEAHVFLNTVLTRTWSLRAFDPRDKVFGILGLPIEGIDGDNHLQRRLLKSDYTKSVANVFRDAVRYSILSSGRLDQLFLLNRVFHRHEQDLQSDGFPSWVPRLDREWNFTVDANSLPYHGDYHTTGHVDQVLVASTIESDLLRLEGILVDEISATSTLLDENATRSFKIFSAWLDSTLEMSSECGVEALARTLVADTNHLRKRSSSVQYLLSFTEMRTCIQQGVSLSAGDSFPPEDPRRRAWEYSLALTRWYPRRIVRTRNHLLGLAPKMTSPGDIVVVLDGSHFPTILRPDGDRYLFIGNCYIDGTMDWQDEYEAFEQRFQQVPKQIFDLH